MSGEPTKNPEHLVFITGKLAHARLEKVANTLPPERFAWSIADAGVKVAALMTEEIIKRRVTLPEGATRIVLPGRCRANAETLAAHFGLPVERGPDEIVDLPAYLGLAGRTVDLSRHDLRIFSEIVDASKMTPEQILAKGLDLARRGADVIDLGGLPDTDFPHLEECVRLRSTSLRDGLPTGAAVATGAGRMRARFVIHTVGPVYGRNEGFDAELLTLCHRNSLAVAHEVGVRTVSFPAISCGIFGYPVEQAAPIAVAAVRSFVADRPDTIDRVRFVLIDDRIHAAFLAALGG